MSKVEIMNKLSRTANKVGFKLKKHSPEILLVTGVVGTVASAVLACKATLKVHEITDEAKENIADIHEATETGVTRAGKPYTAEDSKKDLTIVYAQTGLKFAKLYGPAVVIGAASIGCILASNNIIRKRNIALAAAYATVDNGFKEYRGRVVERFGKELDRELKYNIKAQEIEETVMNEDGTETVVKKTVDAADPNYNSDYARFFDEYCTGWTKDAEYNLTFLKNTQAWFNTILQSKGYVYLNEVYKALGIPETKAGQVVGWVFDKEHPVGDNYIDFGIYDLYNDQKRMFVNGHERSILLDFNVDGNIWELMN